MYTRVDLYLAVHVSTRLQTPVDVCVFLYAASWMSGSTCVPGGDEPWLTALSEHYRPRLPMRLSEAVNRGHSKLQINLLEGTPLLTLSHCTGMSTKNSPIAFDGNPILLQESFAFVILHIVIFKVFV